MTDKDPLTLAHQVLEYVDNLQGAPQAPNIPEEFADDAKFLSYHKKILELRGVISAFAKGDLSVPITERGFFAGSCKALQANLRHMTWVVQQIENGDYTQRIDFLGDFSKSFNKMVVQLKTTIEDLHQKEEALTALAVSLQKEARRRSAVLQELKKSEQSFKELSQRDPLTNLFNRRSFFSFAEMGVESAFSLKLPCCVGLLDLDHFKRVNDQYGHMEGDRALQHVVHISQGKLRQSDIMGRFGGEEFIFFLSMGEELGHAAAERIRLAIEETPLILETGVPLSLTVSIGLAVIEPLASAGDHAKTLRLAINQADAALYEAKGQGRNRVSVAPGASALEQPSGANS